MKGNTMAVFSIVIFLSVIVLLSVGIITQQTTYSQGNSTGNFTIISGGTTNGLSDPPKCIVSPPNQFIVFTVLDTVTCALSFGIWLVSLATVSSPIQWLGFIFIACVAVLIYIVAKLLRGGG